MRAILGVPVALERQAEILKALDFAAEPTSGGLEVTVPASTRRAAGMPSRRKVCERGDG